MILEFEALKKEIEQFSSSDPNEIEKFRIRYLGKNGLLVRLFDEFKLIPPEEKKVYGQKLNTLKTLATDKYNFLRTTSDSKSTGVSALDPSLPSMPLKTGTRHPVSIIRKEIIDIFYKIGFTISEGPEIEDDWHNFSGLNFEPDHPARDMQDTFFIQTDPELLLRTHTSSVQVRVMEFEKPPIRKTKKRQVFLARPKI